MLGISISLDISDFLHLVHLDYFVIALFIGTTGAWGRSYTGSTILFGISFFFDMIGL